MQRTLSFWPVFFAEGEKKNMLFLENKEKTSEKKIHRNVVSYNNYCSSRTKN